MIAKVYIESSVVSYWTAWPSRDLVVAARQGVTRERWARILSEFECHVSVLVVQEIEGGNPQAASARVEAIAGLPILPIDAITEKLAISLVLEGPIPAGKPEDALHIAVAARSGMDYLLTWNFAHIHNAQMARGIQQVVEHCGHQCPIICSPEELTGG